ncbi:MAG: hypothetical protein HC915_16865 [Anaerolineae bacterium]|nr:hypothetical protein [Anaerolineae bacterium]
MRFVEWMMRTDQQAAFTEAFGVLPAQRSALRIWEDEAYTAQIIAWMEDSLTPDRSHAANDAAAQLQAAFIAVLNGTPAEEAATAALANLDS